VTAFGAVTIALETRRLGPSGPGVSAGCGSDRLVSFMPWSVDHRPGMCGEARAPGPARRR
jgi:hypothetical protein